MRFETRARVAKLRHSAGVEDLDLSTPRSLDRAMFFKLSACSWSAERRKLLISENWLARGHGHKACRENISVLYTRTYPWVESQHRAGTAAPARR